MTDDRPMDDGMDAPLHSPDRPSMPDEVPADMEKKAQEPNPLLREGADAPDAADIEDPETQL